MGYLHKTGNAPFEILFVTIARSESWAGARAALGVLQGKYYYETTPKDEGLCRYINLSLH
jgi:hypothetical protein